jgi:uncharacterized membrane protein (GlpM family)
MAHVIAVIVFVILSAISAAVLWGVIKVCNADMRYPHVLIAVIASGILATIPYVGWFLSVVVFLSLMYKLSSINSAVGCWMITILANVVNWALFQLIARILG